MTFSLRLRNDDVVDFSQPAIMGVINVSPNSFYNPHTDVELALKTAEHMVKEGAHILDVGGEATNPFVDIKKEAPSQQAEIDRVLPVVAAIKSRFDILVSVDTSSSEVMRQTVAAGVDIINDQRSLCVGDALATAAALKTPVCLMHFFNPIRQPDSAPVAEMINDIKKDLSQSVANCLAKGITKDRIIIDPGFGGGNYGKSMEENFYLLAHLEQFIAMGFPVLTAWSRKSMIGKLLGGVPADQRLFGSIAADTLCAYFGASIIRTHDVKAISDAIKVAQQLRFSKELQKELSLEQ